MEKFQWILNPSCLPIPPYQLIFINAGDKTRTCMRFNSMDFKSTASAYSATPAYINGALGTRTPDYSVMSRAF